MWPDSARFKGWGGMINTVLHTCVGLKVKTSQPLWSSFVLDSFGIPPVLLPASLFPAVTQAQRAEAASWPSTIPFPAGFQTFHMETPAPEETDSHRPSRLFLTGSRHRACLNSSPKITPLWGALDAASHPVLHLPPKQTILVLLSCHAIFLWQPKKKVKIFRGEGKIWAL